MANHKSAEKRIRQTKVKTLRNKVNRTRVRTMVKTLREAIEAGDKVKATELLTKVQSRLSLTAKNGAMTKNCVARTTSRLTKQTQALK